MKSAIIRLADYRQKVEAPSTVSPAATEKLVKDSIDVEKKTLTSSDQLNKNILELAKVIKENNRLGEITAKASNLKTYGSGSEFLKGKVVNPIKDFFTLRGFLDKTGIVNRGSEGLVGGTIDRILEKREAKQEYIKTMEKTDPSVRLMGKDRANKMFGERFDKSNKIQIDLKKNEAEIERMRGMGLTEQQIQRSPEYKKKAEMEASLAKVDPRFRLQGLTEGGKDSGSKSKERSPLRLVPKSDDDGDKSLLEAAESNEAEVENLRMMDEQNKLLRQIEENTRGEGEKKEEKKDQKKSKFAQMVDDIMGKVWAAVKGAFLAIGPMIGKGLLAGAKLLFNPAFLGKLITKIFPIAMIVGSLVNGIWDGVKAFMETGSIGKALIAGLGGIFSFLTFGLVDAETIEKIVNFVSDSINKYIIEPITAFAEMVANVFDEYILQPLSELLKPLTDFFGKIKDDVMSFVENFGIPAITFTIPVIDKTITIGPWYPFKPSGDTTQSDTGAQNAPAPAGGPKGPIPERVDKAVEAQKEAKAAPRQMDEKTKDQAATQLALKEGSLRMAKRMESQAQFETDPVKKGKLLDMAKRARERAARHEGEAKKIMAPKIEAAAPPSVAPPASEVDKASRDVAAGAQQPSGNANVNTVVVNAPNNSSNNIIAAPSRPRPTEPSRGNYLQSRAL